MENNQDKGSHCDSDSNKVRVIFVYPDGTNHAFVAHVGETLLQVAHKNDVPLEGACGGSLACSTCHVIVEPEYFCQCNLSVKSVQEEDMLDLAFGVEPTSRLGCQVRLDKTMDGLVVRVPADTRNLSKL